MSPLFSVVIPAYNRADLLKLTLKSLSLQTFKDYEAFIIDDGSTDNTPEIFNKFQSSQNWYFFRFETNRKQAYCRNFAIKRSGGKYVTFLDADDVWLPERLEKFAELVSNNPKAGFVFSNGYIMRDNAITGRFFGKGREIPKGKLPSYMAISNYWLPYVTTNVAFLKEAVNKAGYFREDMSHLEDMELYVKILKFCEVDYINMPLSVYRIHTFTNNPKSLTLKWDAGIKDFLDALETAEPEPKIAKLLKNYTFYNQAVVFFKNGFGLKARQYLLKTDRRNASFFILYISSFIPAPIFPVLRFFYRLFGKVKLKLKSPGSGEFRKIEDWIIRLQD